VTPTVTHRLRNITLEHGRKGSQTSRGRGTGFAGPQAQRPLGGQRSTRSDERGGPFLFTDQFRIAVMGLRLFFGLSLVGARNLLAGKQGVHGGNHKDGQQCA
jgi:hypothetical protein